MQKTKCFREQFDRMLLSNAILCYTCAYIIIIIIIIIITTYAISKALSFVTIAKTR